MQPISIVFKRSDYIERWCSYIQVSCLITVAALRMILSNLSSAQEENIEERKVEKKVVVDQELLQVTTNKCLNNLYKCSFCFYCVFLEIKKETWHEKETWHFVGQQIVDWKQYV